MSTTDQNSITLAPEWHPLTMIDQFILDCGWTHTPEGFVPPEKWREPIAREHGGGLHWKREHAIQFCVRYHEVCGFNQGWHAMASKGLADPINPDPDEPARPARSRVHKTTRTLTQDRPGHYLVMAGSNSVWAGFHSKTEALASLLVLPGWQYLERI